MSGRGAAGAATVRPTIHEMKLNDRSYFIANFTENDYKRLTQLSRRSLQGRLCANDIEELTRRLGTVNRWGSPHL